MTQDEYRPLVEAEYNETWVVEDFEDVSSLAWRCACARTVLNRLPADELQSLTAAWNTSHQLKIDSWESDKGGGVIGASDVEQKCAKRSL